LTRPFDKAKYNALLNGLEISEVKLSEVHDNSDLRMDSEFYRKRPLEICPSLRWERIGSLLKTAQYGASIEMSEGGDDGSPIYRMNELHDLFADLRVSKRAALSRDDEKAFRLYDKDVLFNRTNSFEWVGRTALYREYSKVSHVFASYLVRLVPNRQVLLPEYLVLFLSSRAGVWDVKRRARISINQSNVNASEVKEILIPLVSMPFQKSLASLMDQANQFRIESDESYQQAVDSLSHALNIPEEISNNHGIGYKSFAESFAVSGRLDAEFYQPKYDELFERIHANAEYVKTISELETFNARGLQPVYEEFGTLPVINSRHILEDGLDYESFERTGSDFWESQKRARVKRNDILVYTTGANIGRSQPYLADKPALASNHVNILRIKGEDPLYVAFVMNSLIGRMQTERLSAGTAQAELYPKDLSLFVIPFVPKKKQEEIVSLLLEAREKKAESFECLEKAKRAVEIAIEQGEEAAMAYLEGRHYVEQTVVQDLANQAPYFSIDAVRHWLADQKMSYKPDTVKTYLSRQKRAGKIFDAGKGWYSNLPEPLTLNPDSLTPITKCLSDQFPLLDVSCWSTEQVNPFMHHLLAKFVTFVYTDADALETVGDALSDAGHNVLVNPGKNEIEKFYGKTERPVIIRPSVTKEPAAVSGMSPPEKLLVDLVFENNKLMIMEPSEADDVVQKAVQAGRVNMAVLLSYAKRRRVLVNV